MAAYPAFIGGSNPTQSRVMDAEMLVNGYVEKAQSQGAKNSAGIYPSPGYELWSPAGVANVGGRASILAEGRYFTVHAGDLVEWDVFGAPTIRSTFPMVQDAFPVHIVYNGKVGGQLGIRSGGAFYVFTMATNAFAFVAGLTFTHFCVANNVGLGFDSATGSVRLSALNDLLTWPGGVFFQRALQPDPWQAMFVDTNNLVWMIGTDTFEVWYLQNSSSTQPFAPLLGLAGRYGILAPYAFSVNDAGIFWLASNPEGPGQLVMSQGGSPQSVNTYAVSTKISSYARMSRIDDAELLSYQEDNHTFVCVSFPSVPATWCYDATSPDWTQRGVWNPVRGDYDLWSPRAHTYAFGKHLIVERTTGKVWNMTIASALEISGVGIRRLRRAPAFTREHKRIPIDQFELLMDVGLGLQAGQGSDPQVMLRVSQDGGITWGNERRASTGKVGKFGKRVYWTRLGAPPDCALEISYSEPIPFRIVNSWLNNFEKAA